MAVFGFSWVIPMAVGPLLAGVIMDNGDPRWVWHAAGLVGLVAAGAFALLQRRVGRSAEQAALENGSAAPFQRESVQSRATEAYGQPCEG